ncbi:MAG: C39 family peptidase, partial [Oscillospiraceae bacterium]
MKQKIVFTAVVVAVITLIIAAPKLLRPAALDCPEICAFAEENNLSVSAYPKALVSLYERNPEARDFVLNFPLKKDSEQDYEITLPEDGSVPLFMQWDERWGYEEYSGEIMGLSGCGPTALSMAAVYLLGDTSLSPAYIADFSEENGFSSRSNGTSWTLMNEGAQQLGLCSGEVPLWEASMANALSEGKLIVCAMGKGDFTSTGHFILLTGYSEGLFSLNDPNSR